MDIWCNFCGTKVNTTSGLCYCVRAVEARNTGKVDMPQDELQQIKERLDRFENSRNNLCHAADRVGFTVTPITDNPDYEPDQAELCPSALNTACQPFFKGDGYTPPTNEKPYRTPRCKHGLDICLLCEHGIIKDDKPSECPHVNIIEYRDGTKACAVCHKKWDKPSEFISIRRDVAEEWLKYFYNYYKYQKVFQEMVKEVKQALKD